MKKLFRKGAAIILALGMCLTALTGCNSSKEAGEDGALTLFYSDLSGVNTAIIVHVFGSRMCGSI